MVQRPFMCEYRAYILLGLPLVVNKGGCPDLCLGTHYFVVQVGETSCVKSP